jgi:predicted nuclease with TOPRIM domain
LEAANSLLQEKDKKIGKMRALKGTVKNLKSKVTDQESLIEDLVAENTRLVIVNANLKTVDKERAFLEKKLTEMQALNAQLEAQNRGLKHEAQLQLTLRDQFKSFVKDNMTAFDIDKTMDFSSHSQSLDENVRQSVSPVAFRSSKPLKEAQSHNHLFSTNQSKRQIESNLARRKQYAEEIRQR